jgi:hypothetical protein
MISPSGGSGYANKYNLDFQYFFFGHCFSCNLPLPGVSPTNPSKGSSDIALHLGVPQQSAQENPPGSEELIYASTETNAAGEPVLRILKVARGEFVRLAYEDGTKFWLDQRLENVWATWPDTSSLENTASYLLGPVLGLLLRLRGVTCLHASAVSFGERSVAFVGATGAGKSTTAAAFARQGYTVLSDDIVPLEERQGDFYVQPAYPYLCLWPDSVRMLYGSLEGFPPFIPDWDKRRLDLGQQGTRFESRSLKLGAIYVLGERRPDPAPYIESMKPQEAFLALVADTYANKILDREMRASEFAVLGRLVSSVPVRRVRPHEDAGRLEELCKVIRRDFDSLELQQSARN